MAKTTGRAASLVALVVVGVLTTTGCGAGSRVGTENATQVPCEYEAPDGGATVNVLAYNSSAIDPFTDTMVTSCSTGDVRLKHDPIDFGGQVTKTTATLAGDTGTYDILETYGFVTPGLAEDEKLAPLGDLYDKYADEYGLDAISEPVREGMSFDGELYALPMQSQMYVMAYRADVFEKIGMKAPTTFDEMIAAAEKIRAEGLMEHPIALPWLATNDVTTSYQGVMNSLGADFIDQHDDITIDTPQGKQALEAMLALKPFMDPQVTTFDQPKVQQQMANGTAAMSIMFSGQMVDLLESSSSRRADSIDFAAAPRVTPDAPYSYNRLSIDGWSIPFNTEHDPDMLFRMMASSVSEKSSKAAVPAAYPAREGLVTGKNSPYGAAANESMRTVMPPISSPILPQVHTAIRPTLVAVLNGEVPVDAGLAKMQAAAEDLAG